MNKFRFGIKQRSIFIIINAQKLNDTLTPVEGPKVSPFTFLNKVLSNVWSKFVKKAPTDKRTKRYIEPV